MDPLEQYCVAAIAQARHVKTVFEIGTFDGATSYLLAKVLPAARIFTLDLPPEVYAAPSSPHPGRADDATPSLGNDDVGARFHGQAEEQRITQLLGDSRTFDYGAYVGHIDLVIVDGGHEYATVRDDTENALRLRSPNGIVVWDDYSMRWPGVVRAVDEAADRHESPLIRLAQTDLAVLDPSRASGLSPERGD